MKKGGSAMRKMRQGTVAKLERFWNALSAAAHGPLRKADYPFNIAARCGIKKAAARILLDVLRNAGYFLPVIDRSVAGSPLIATQLLKTEFIAADFPVSKKAARKLKLAAVPAPTLAPVVEKITFRQRIALFLDLDNLCINLKKLGMILGINELRQEAAREGPIIGCFGFIQRSTLERNREAVNGFPPVPEIFLIVSPDYSQASDQAMLSAMRNFADNDIADVFFIGTADTKLFEAAQYAVKRVKKRAVLLDCCKLSFGIRTEADRIFRVQNAAVPESKQRLQQCAERIAKTKRLGRGQEAEFLRNVVRKLRMVLSGDFNQRGEEFRNLQNRVWHFLKQRGETIGWHPQDCQYALEALRTLGILMPHRSADEKTYYRLNREAETHGVF